MGTDPALDALSDPTRRAVVAVLSRRGAVTRERLVESVAASDQSGSRRHVRAALATEHLPRLADAGVVAYDDASVTPGPRLAAAAAHLGDDESTREASEADPTLREQLAAFYA